MVKSSRAEPADSSNLRKSAEELLSRHIGDLEAPSPAEVQQLVYALEVHRVELEMQNEELREAQQELEVSRDRYASSYDCAPLGYVSLDKDGRIQEINFAATKLLGRERARVTGRLFVTYVATEDLSEPDGAGPASGPGGSGAAASVSRRFDPIDRRT